MNAPMLARLSMRRSVVPVLLVASLSLLRADATLLMDSNSPSDATGDGRPTATSGLPFNPVGPAPSTLQSRRQSNRRPIRRADISLTLGGRLLLNGQSSSEGGGPTQAPAPGDQLETPQSVVAAESGPGRRRSPLAAGQRSRRLPPEFLVFPVYRSNEINGREAAEGSDGDRNDNGDDGRGRGGRQPALESPLVVVTTTTTPNRPTIPPTPKETTTSAPVEALLPTPSAFDCDSPGGPPASLATRCRALRQLRRRTLQHRRRAAQLLAQQQLQRIIDLHLADVSDSLTVRALRPESVELKRKEPPPSRETTTESADELPFAERLLEETSLLRARAVPQPIPAPHTATVSPAQRNRRRKTTLPAATRTPPPEQPDWALVRASAAGDNRHGVGTETAAANSGSGRLETAVAERPHLETGTSHREINKLHRDTDKQHKGSEKPHSEAYRHFAEIEKRHRETETTTRETDKPNTETDKSLVKALISHLKTEKLHKQFGKPHKHVDTLHINTTNYQATTGNRYGGNNPAKQQDKYHKDTSTRLTGVVTPHKEPISPHGRTDGTESERRWRTYSSVSPNSIRTAPDRPEEHVAAAISPLPTAPGSLFTTTIVPEGGMPITQKGVIPGLLDIPARVYFSCRHRAPGFYGNSQTGCQVYHQCTPDGKKYDYLCGVGTAFNAKTNTCDHWYNTSCERY
ncbi:uncharacterized protein LOC122382680 [Amphibalanus amphitrite]|uniref:uncharacterized protein LOC122382680 n=1 Tax=Amphibalanus amphitrite TaxID=1232801 RepID=UPI001C91BD07|nr:uncharacterized protein LOC122382680 [Amphibalanus amphitrite]